MKIFVYEVRGDEREALARASEQFGAELALSEEVPSAENAGLAAGCEGVSVLGQGKLDKTLLRAFRELGVKYLSTRTVGYNRIDLAAAKELGVPAELLPTEAPAPEARSPLSLFADELFSYSETTAEASGSIELWKTDSPMAECEFAAAEALRLVRETGCRWRDIAIAVRGFSSYSAALESVFEEYGVPLFTAEKVSLASRPLPSLIRSAYAILAKGWREDDVLSYMDTGLTGLTRQECDDLSEYISRWQLSDRAWHSSAQARSSSAF